MKSVLISIQPKWCELIASGKKTVEVRKTRPKLETPFKVYIYCTKGEPLIKSTQGHGRCFVDGYTTEDNLYGLYELLNGKVIGEFVCDTIETLTEQDLFEGMDEISNSRIEEYSCVDIDRLLQYKGSKNEIYGWHISDLVIYDKPRELSEFKKPCTHKNDCCTCDRYDYIGHRCYDDITRPFQSWGYVESEEQK